MTDNENLIEEAAKAMQAFVYSGAPEWEGVSKQIQEQWLGVARAALAVFEEAHTPTDDERESLARTIYLWDVAESVSSTTWGDLLDTQRDVWLEGADFVLAAGFRRTEVLEPSTEGKPSDAQVEASARRLFGATVDSMDRARELARVALTCPPLVACPHWAPGKITFRNGCTACSAESQT